ncbi:PAS domain-containing hybrid sensor histidine kinase/response regulator [Parashewanella tropica]|uniref:PAS domain-containing hybrid sensor histidine kinase/response regulator n=1 Tax=Parashewanella tropica TaxID=2547970 RepID=UPI00105949B2|nr:PAS domain-containing hybrid sensor histidine kinase/response regulator [Parashewanella tropica]
MFHSWQLLSFSILYIALLFWVAYLGDKFRHKLYGNKKAVIYALTLGVYCTSWSFLGTTAQSANNIFSHIPIYLGPILLFTFAWPFLLRIIRVSLQLNLTSIADLLAVRFGKSTSLAKLVTLVALVGTLPYLVLQIKSIVYSFELLQIEPIMPQWLLGLIVSLIIVVFTVLFGIRHIHVTESNPQMMLAIAFESVIKLTAFVVLAVLVCFFVFDSPMQIWQQADIDLDKQLSFPNLTSLFGMLVVVMAAFLALPRQFQVMVVEASHVKDTKYSRPIFILYLTLFAIMAIPLGLAGVLLFGDQVAADSYVLRLSIMEQSWISLLVFLGAISAASSMMIISSLALSTMLSNEIVFPILFQSKHQQSNYQSFQTRLLNIRKVLVLLIILMGYSAFLVIDPDRLASLGEIAFGALAQLTPALIAAFYWRNASLTGVFTGITVGFSLWLFLNFLPNLGIYELSLANEYLSSNTGFTLFSLAANTVVMILISLFSRKSVHERIQATFFHNETSELSQLTPKRLAIDSSELQLLLAKFLGEDTAEECMANFKRQVENQSLPTEQYNQILIHHAESALASMMGASSARMLIHSVLQGRNINLTELAALIEEASNQQQLKNLSILHSAIEHASEGISIVDKELNLVAWNRKYLDIFNYPKGVVIIGAPIEDLIRYNLSQIYDEHIDLEKAVQKRLAYLKQGTPHASERTMNSGQVITIEGNPLPNGGFVMMFRDITTYRQAEQVLKEQNLDLETVVQARTKELKLANEQLAISHQKARLANQKKSLYLKACSHDLMQPLEAARLFTSALSAQNKLSDSQRQQVGNIEQSLKVANDMLSSLGDMARIEGGNIKVNTEVFSLFEFLTQLEEEFTPVAEEKQLDFHVDKGEGWLSTDRHLLRRILQNLITNAFRYANEGQISVSVNQQDSKVDIAVIDNGPGIAAEDQALIFEPFTQLENSNSKGLGLGLNITRAFADRINVPISLTSVEGQGCRFSLSLPLVANPNATQPQQKLQSSLQGVSVLCIDNDPEVLAGMVELLSAWKCNVVGVASREQAIETCTLQGNRVEIILADYQLDDNDNGLDVIKALREHCQRTIPAILITATTEADIEQKAQQAKAGYMRKMVKPAALRAMMSAMLTQTMQDKYGQVLN